MKKHAGLISNAVIVLLVLGAVYVKNQSDGVDALFKSDDIYILVGAVLAFAVLRVIASRQQKNKK